MSFNAFSILKISIFVHDLSSGLPLAMHWNFALEKASAKSRNVNEYQLFLTLHFNLNTFYVESQLYF